jgi:hypothetical protein
MSNNFSTETMHEVRSDVIGGSIHELMNASSEDIANEVRISNLKKLRLSWNESQTKFWCRFGVTQSRGSRFEKGIGIPHSVAMLMDLYFEDKVSDNDLLRARTISDQPKELQSKVNLVINKTRE